jgi:hypothetical protein
MKSTGIFNKMLRRNGTVLGRMCRPAAKFAEPQWTEASSDKGEAARLTPCER